MQKNYFTATELRESIQRSMDWLIENIPAMPHVNFLCLRGALNEDDHAKISNVHSETGKVSTLIKFYNVIKCNFNR